MTTEETELTFVRCPSCRSLVPAVATRCRMCGYQFEGNAGENGDSQAGAKPKSRIRQLTISVTKNEVEEMGLLDDTALGSSDSDQLASDEVVSEDSSVQDNPIAPDSFLQDLDRALSQPPEELDALGGLTDAPSEDQDPLSGFSSLDDGGADQTLFSSPAEGVAEEPEPDAALFSIESEESDGAFGQKENGTRGSAASDFSAEQSASDADSTFDPLPIEDVSSSASLDDKEIKSADAPSSSDDMSASGGDSGDQAEQRPAKKRRRRRRKRRSEGSDSGQVGTDAGQAGAQAESDAVSSEMPQEAPVAEEVPLPTAQAESVTAEPTSKRSDHNINQDSKRRTMKEAVARSSKTGVLLGWLVRYEQNEPVSSIELRSGRFFLGGKRLRESDLVIEDESISTPHCLVNASRNSGLILQDMVSEQGTLIKRSGQDNFEEIEDSVDVEHGDSIRFGSFEVTVCLIP